VTTAVSASGLVEGPFLFLGFLPRRGARRDALLQRIARSTEPCVLFEAPNRLGDTLKELAELIGEREACVARELSKLHEELRPGTLSELAEHGAWRGECTLVIAAAPERPQLDAATDDTALQAEIVTALRAGAGTRALAEALAERLGRPRKQMYALVLQGRSAAGTDHGESD
jgi:16S rRNA (cytidine1402-2'-O)-methyltransferase